MKASTTTVMAANSVGNSTESPLVVEGTIVQCMVELAKWLGIQTMHKRFDIVFARDKETALGALSMRKDRGQTESEASESMATMLAKAMGLTDEEMQESAQ